MQTIILHISLAGAFGAFIGLLFRLVRRSRQERAHVYTLVGLVAGLTAYVIFFLLAQTTGAPVWLLPLLILLQVWLWLGPLGPKYFRTGNNRDTPR